MLVLPTTQSKYQVDAGKLSKARRTILTLAPGKHTHRRASIRVLCPFLPSASSEEHRVANLIHSGYIESNIFL